MIQMDNTEISMAQQLTTELYMAVSSGEEVDPELIELADNVIRAHQVYVQLLYVSMVVDRITQLTHYFDALDATVEILDTEDLAEASTGEKIRAVSALNQAIKNKIEIINNMTASKDAIGMITANMKDTFGAAETLTEGITKEGQEQFLNKLLSLPSNQRQRILSMVVTAIQEGLAERGV
jgi:hypothetical protein